MLVDEPSTRGASFNPVTWAEHHDIQGVVGCALVDSTVGAVLASVGTRSGSAGPEQFRRRRHASGRVSWSPFTPLAARAGLAYFLGPDCLEVEGATLIGQAVGRGLDELLDAVG